MAERYDFVRRETILDVLSDVGSVTVNELSDRFGVSPVTVRKDLDSLEERKLLRRVRGGAVPLAQAQDEGAFDIRLRTDSPAKQAIARHAAREVIDGDTILLDSSTTSYFLGQEITDRRGLTVVTNGLRCASLLMDHSDATVIMPGGILRRSSSSMVGPLTDVFDGRGRVRIGFFGVAGLSPSRGLLEVSVEECEAKKAFVRGCERVIALFPSAKAHGFGLHAFVAPADVEEICTDDAIDDTTVGEWEAMGVSVTRVPLASPSVHMAGATSA